jgi:hypothetical protein
MFKDLVCLRGRNEEYPFPTIQPFLYRFVKGIEPREESVIFTNTFCIDLHMIFIFCGCLLLFVKLPPNSENRVSVTLFRVHTEAILSLKMCTES